jgi:toxin ParE1/3/4
LRHIWRRVATDNETAADELLARMFDRLELAATQPYMGVARPELSSTARILVEGRYVLIYEPMSYGIFVVAFVHGMRDPKQWLK